jgi:iron complex outermembrane receptor protein
LLTYTFRTALLAGAIAAYAPAAFAQETKYPVATVSTVEVRGRAFTELDARSASKGEADILELPRAVSVVTAEEFRNRASENLTQIFQYTPGFNGDAYGGGALKRSFSNARGFLAFQYLDGLKLHDSNWGIEPYGLERAELLRGPASALYGQANPGGIVALTSKRPTSTPLGEMNVQVGSHGRLQGSLDLGGALFGRDDLSYRFSALARDADTEIEHTKDNRVFVSGGLTWYIGANTELTALASYQWDPELVVFQYLPRVGSLDPSPFGKASRHTYLSEPGYDNTTKAQSQLAFLFEQRLGDEVTLRSNVRYTYIDISARFLQAGALTANQRTVARTAVFQEYIIAVAQIDNQVAARFDTGPLSHNILMGADYAYIPSYQGTGTRAGPTLDLYAPVYGTAFLAPVLTTKRQQHQRQTGLYAQDQIKFGDVSILAGIRRDHATVSTRNRNALTGVAPNAIKQRDWKTTWQLGASYEVVPGLAPYVSYATSFYPTPGTDFFGYALVPATGKQIEGGVKYQPRGFDALFSAAVFDLKQNNVRTADTAHPGFLIQTGQVRSKGYELEGRGSPIEGLNLALAYTYLDNKVTKSTQNTLGKRPAGRPKHQASAWADYALGAGFTVGGGARYVGKSFGDGQNTFSVPSYTLVDALLRYDLGRFGGNLERVDVSLNALNLSNKRYVVNCDAASQCFYGTGRIVKATVTKRW